MQIQSIRPYSIYTNAKAQETNQNLKANCYATNNLPLQQVYAHNVYGINFGAGKYKSSFEQEIAEQPKVIGKLSSRFFPATEGSKINMNLDITPEEVNNLKSITIIASGSSKNAGEMAAGFIEDVTHIPVNVISASEFEDKNHTFGENKISPLLNSKNLAIFISQSGNTADTYKALKDCKYGGCKTFAVTNNPESKIAYAADSHVFIDAGEENAVAATKTVTSSIYALMAMGLKLAEIGGRIDDFEMEAHRGDMMCVPTAISQLLKDTDGVKKAADIISKSNNIYYYAKGCDVGAVREGALKLTETTGKKVIADSSSEALHGMFASIQPQDPVLQIISYSNMGNDKNMSIENIREMVEKRHIKHPIIIKDAKTDKKSVFPDENTLNKAIFINYSWQLDGDAEYYEPYTNIAPLLATVRFQQITNEVTKNLGINPDNGGGFLTKFRDKMSM